MKVYLKNEKLGVDAVGDYNPSDNSLVVLANSVISSSVSTAPTFRGKNTILKTREKYAEGTIVKTDAPFKSPSTAGNFVTGRSTDGPSVWKDKHGRPIKIIINLKKEN